MMVGMHKFHFHSHLYLSLPNLSYLSICLYRCNYYHYYYHHEIEIGMQHLLQGDGVQAFLSSLQAANSSDASTNPTSSAGENKEADTSTSAPPTNLFGSDPDESKDNDKMEE